MINELGYPNRHSLRNWYTDYVDYGVVRESTHRPLFCGDEEKRRAVEHFAIVKQFTPNPVIAFPYEAAI